MDSMLSKALREFMTGSLKQLVVNLGGRDGKEWEEELKKFLRKEPCWSNEQVVQLSRSLSAKSSRTDLLKPDLLQLLCIVVVAVSEEQFVAREKFVWNMSLKGETKISHLSDNFHEWFLGGDGKIEERPEEASTMGKTMLGCYRLGRSSLNNRSIITEFGGEEKSETTLRQVFSLLEKQKKRVVSGVLLDSGGPNIFYIRDMWGELRAVSVRWYDGGWQVSAAPLDVPTPWRSGHQVFSPSLVLDSST